jgi:hypothetical protein
MRNYGRSDGPGLMVWASILAVILVLIGAVALAIYGGSVRPAQHEVEQVLSNDRFAR